MRGSARIYDVRMAQFVLEKEKLSHIMGPRASQDLRSPSLIMAPDQRQQNEECRSRHSNQALPGTEMENYPSNMHLRLSVI